MKIVLVAVPLINTRVPPLSIACLAGHMRSLGHKVKAFDFNIDTYHNVPEELKEYWTYYKGFQWIDNEYFESFIYPNIIGKNIDNWVERILAEKPDVVGISVTHSPSGRVLAQALKKVRPDIKIIIGGPSCTKPFNDSEKTPCSIYDVVVHNEGELTLAEVIQKYEQTGEFQPVLGASILDKNGNVIFPGLRPAQMELDQLATPDFDDLDLSKYVDADNPAHTYREIPYYTSRGCPARCNFCMDYKMWDLRYRQKSPQRVVDEMQYLSQRYGTKKFMLIELIFNGHMKKMRELNQELVRRKLNFQFWGHGRIDPRLDKETLQVLKEAGFYMFIFGLESASNPVLKLMRKGYTAETADRVLTDMTEVGLDCAINVIVGFPGETWEDYKKTIHFIYKHRKGIACMPGLSACNAMPGSDIYLYPEKFSIQTDHDGFPPVEDWVSCDGTNTLEMRNFRKEFMLDVFKKFKFKGDPQDKPDYDIRDMPDPERVYNKLLKKQQPSPLRSAISKLTRFDFFAQ